MPIHDWTRVSNGAWHAFRLSWISEIQQSLNAGLLPDDYYAQAEQLVGPMRPDVLTFIADRMRKMEVAMPIHDWTRVSDGTWHDFHVAWITEVRNALNAGLLPDDYYAQAEQLVGPMGPDVLTLQETDTPLNGSPISHTESGGIALATAPPPARFIVEDDMSGYVRKQRALVIRHSSGDRIVALLEIVSPGNKSSRNGLRSFVEKAVQALDRGYHLLIIDLFPPTKRDPQGIHEAIWSEFSEDSFELPKDEPFTLVSYLASPLKRAYIEPTAVGRELPDRPLFLTDETYVYVPLEKTYQAAFRGVPRKWREVLQAV